MRPSEKDYAPDYKDYIEQIKGDDIVNILEEQLNTTTKFFNSIPEEKGNYSYADGKWSIKEVLGHLIDSERIFAFRALCIARGEKQSLPGFEQDDYAKEGGFNKRTLKNLLEELNFVREANLSLFKSFSENEFNKRGVASENEVTVRAILFIIAGHGMHHFKVLKEKYGV
jgi:uncharacterized damage-inducible protein DinB